MAARKEGYVFHVSPDGLHFSHQQLGSLRVVARDLAGNPIEGVLLALSSETAKLTGVSRSDGSAVFGPLFPGRYYLHAQLKEFRFLPAGQTVDVAEGDESGVSLQGERIAFSAFGSVVTLTGQPLPRKKIIAESPAGIRESASTDLEGNFRVRGLKPGERFSLQVLGEEHVIPAVQEIEITAGDVRDVKFVSLRERTAGRVSGVVESEGAIPAGMKVVVEGKEGRKTGKVTRGGSFEVKEVKEGKVRVKVEGGKGRCEEIEREIRKNEANHVVLHCEAEKTAEMEVSSGGSFVILAIAMIALFGFMERELFYWSVCWNQVDWGSGEKGKIVGKTEGGMKWNRVFMNQGFVVNEQKVLKVIGNNQIGDISYNEEQSIEVVVEGIVDLDHGSRFEGRVLTENKLEFHLDMVKCMMMMEYWCTRA